MFSGLNPASIAATVAEAKIMDEAIIAKIARAIHDEIENDDDSGGGAYLRAARALLPLVGEEMLRIVKEQKAVFASDEYAVGQPLSSFAERFACDAIAESIQKSTGANHDRS